ncbi:MAG: acyloxyacyl hydrolase, partial [Gallionella sp.]
GYRFQHLSNGSIKQPNQGINFNQIRFTCHF